jgi:hypothetical protein
LLGTIILDLKGYFPSIIPLHDFASATPTGYRR